MTDKHGSGRKGSTFLKICEDLLEGRLPDDTWKEHFRLSRQTFLKICDLVRPELSRQDTRLRSAIPLEKRVAVALYRLATGDSFGTSALTFGLPKSTANIIKRDFCKVIRRKAAQFIKFPVNFGRN